MVVFHFMYLKQACRRRDNAKSMDHLMPRRLRMCSEICNFVNSIVCMFSGLATPKSQTSGLARRCQALSVHQTHSVKHYRRY